MERLKLFVTLLLIMLAISGVGVKAATSTTASFEGSGSNVGKTLSFDYEFTTSGSSVTLTVSNVNGTDVTGLNSTPNIYDWTSGSEDSKGAAMSYTWSDVTVNTTLKVKLHWAATDGSFWTDYLTYTVSGSGENTPPATSTITNLALNKTAIATSETKSAGNAVDGNSTGDSRWESAPSDPQTWQVDLGNIRKFDAIVIKWETAYAKSFTITAGNKLGADGYLDDSDAATKTLATKTDQDLNDNLTQTLTFDATEARYVKFHGTARATQYGYSFYEFEVYGDNYDNSAPDYPTTVPTIKTVGTTVGEKTITEVKALYNQGAKQNGFDFANWGGQTDPTTATVDGKAISLFSKFNYFGGEYTGFDATQWDKLVIDVYPMTDMTVNVYPLYVGIASTDEKSQSFTTTKGQWNTLEVDLQTLKNSGLTITNLNQLKMDGCNNTAQFYVGNIYYYTTQQDLKLTISGSNSIEVGETAQFSYTATNYSSEPVTHSSVTWTSSDPTVGTINESGLFTARAEGTTSITATSGEVTSNSITVTVNNVVSTETQIPTTVKIYIKGEAVSGINMIDKTYAQGDLEVRVLDQNGILMVGRNVTLSIVNSDSKATLVNTTVASGGATAFQTNEWEGQTTIQGVDASGVTGYCYITCFDNTNNLVNPGALNNGQSLDVKECSSGGVEYGIKTSDDLWADGTKETHFGVDLKGYYDISAFQLMFDQGKFPTEYTIQVAQSGADYAHAVWKDVYHYTPSKEVYVADKYRCDVWNEQSNFTKAIRYIRFTSTSEAGVTFKRFQVLGKYVSDAISDTDAPVVVSANASEITKNSAVITMVGTDKQTSNLTYILTDKATGLTHTVQAPTSTTIYVKAQDAPALYAYKDDGTKLNGDDGTTMTIKENEYWKQTFSYSPININFRSQPNNSSPTTPNINNLTGDNYFTYNGNTGYTRENVPNKVSVYVKADTAPYLYVWDDSENALNGTWPGTQLTQKSGEYWVYTYDANHINIQFNNGNDGDTNKSWAVTGVSGENYFTYNGTNSHTSDNHATYALSNLQASTTYTYEVVAFDGANYSAPVDVTFTTLADDSAPTVVFDSTDPVTNILSDGATLNFTGTDANGQQLTYIITNKNTGAVTQTTGNSGTAVAYEVQGLTHNTEYTFGVKAYNGTLFSGEATTTFTTKRLGGELKIKFSESDTWKEGFTGELESLITATNTQLLNVTTLYIDGPLNSEDIKTLRTMGGGKYQISDIDYNTNTGSLSYLNLEAASFVGDGGVYVETEYKENGQHVRWDPVYLIFTNSDIDNYVFYGCKNLQTVVLPTGVNRLGEYSFFRCDNLETINTENVKVFDRSCFQYDKKLGQITISDGTTTLAYAAFSLCENLTLASTVLPSSISLLHDLVFQNCYKLTEITYPNNEALAETATGVFQNCTGLVTLNMPSTTRTIGYMFCQNCTNLVDLNFYNATDATQTGAQYNNVLNIVACAFDNCSKLYDASVAAFTKATLMGNSAFQNCDQISTTTVNQLLAQITDATDDNTTGTVVRDNDDYAVAESLFANCDGFTQVTIPSQIVKIKNQAFVNCSNLETITIGENVASTGTLVFANCRKLHKVNVSRGIAPICDQTELSEVKQEEQTIEGKEQMVDVTYYYNIFNDVPANQVTLNFTGDAAGTGKDSGYKTYRAQKHFMYLLTKTLDETATKYDVAGQMHADVVLKRTMVEGWNTVALPFGVKSGDGTARDRGGITAAGVYQKAFNGENYDRFMIAAYRGIDTSNAEDHVFKFLKYADYTTDPLDEFEPLLIRMGKDNLSANNEYTFTDVDLNYDAEEGKLYREGNKEEDVPVKKFVPATTEGEEGTWEGFVGNYNRNDMKQFKDCKDDFAFTGTYSTKTTLDIKNESGGIVYGSTAYAYTGLGSDGLGSDYFLNEGDYIIQDNLFYKVVKTNNYGLRGYRAWFKQQPTTPTETRSSKLMFQVVEMAQPEVPTEIESLDSIDSDVEPFDVYSLGGQMLRKQTKSLSGLPNGIYIVNGRKVAVGR